MARVLGLEPRITESKSVVLPLHYTGLVTIWKHTISNLKGTRENATHTCEIRYNMFSYGRCGETRTHNLSVKSRLL